MKKTSFSAKVKIEMKNLILFFLTLLAINTGPSAWAKSVSPQKVWIDFDIAFGKTIRDIDDGVALIHALNSPNLEIAGISFCFGNIDNFDYMETVTRKILRLYGKNNIPTFKGSRRNSARHTLTPAVRAMAAELSHGPLTIISLGRLTNISGLIKHFPTAASNITTVIFNAGRRLETQTRIGRFGTILPDTNVDDDLLSVKDVLESGVHLTLVPTEAIKDAPFTKGHEEMLKESKRVNPWMGQAIKRWRSLWKVFPGMNSFLPFDLYAVSILTHPEDFHCDNNIPLALVNLKNQTSSLFRLKYFKKRKDFLVASYSQSSAFRGKYCYSIDDHHLNQVLETWAPPLSESKI